jgi:hypothetical protein
VWQRTQVQIVGVEAFRTFTARPLDFGASDGGLDNAGNSLDEPVLEIEDIRRRALETVSPYMNRCGALDEMAVDPQAVAGSATLPPSK